MKNAKDYIEETSPNTQRITSFAYWLTPEGMSDPITAALVREAISTGTDEDFKEAFDGATKEEAANYLAQWELCYMAQWGASELVNVIVLSDAGRNEALALRAVNLAQSAGELPEVFSTREGITWAMARGYLITRNICAWCGVTPGNYGHPSNPLSPVDAPAAKVVTQKRQRQDALAVELDEILVSMETRTPAKAMAELRKQIGKPNTCILRNAGDGIEWENDRGVVKSLTIVLLGERIREWKKTSLSQG